MKIYFTWNQITRDIDTLTELCKDKNISTIVGIGRGGLIPATLLSYKLNVKIINNFQVQSYNDNNEAEQIKIKQVPSTDVIEQSNSILVVDDLSDKGTTLAFVKEFFKNTDKSIFYATLYTKDKTTFVPDFFVRTYSNDDWLVFPWD